MWLFDNRNLSPSLTSDFQRGLFFLCIFCILTDEFLCAVLHLPLPFCQTLHMDQLSSSFFSFYYHFHLCKVKKILKIWSPILDKQEDLCLLVLKCEYLSRLNEKHDMNILDLQETHLRKDESP